MCDRNTETYDGYHSASCIHRHGLLMMYMSFRALIDDQTTNERVDNLVLTVRERIQEMREFILDPEEIDFFHAPAGSLPPSWRAQASWLIEGAPVAAWAVRVADMPHFDQYANVNDLRNLMGMFEAGANDRFLTLEPRPFEEIVQRANIYAVLYWRMAQMAQSPGKADMAERIRLAEMSEEGLQKAGIWLIDNDLAIDGQPITEVSPERLGIVHGIIWERFRTFDWLLSHKGFQTLPPAAVN